MTYRDQQTALNAKVQALETELAEVRAEASRHREENERLRARVGRFRLARSLSLAAVGAVGGLLLSVFVAVAADNIRLIIPGTLIGSLCGMLTGLARDIDG